ncbi:MAG: hypothetical protein KJ607_03475 [Bacteroidetes bacterium]|nr:hypothetical protein [Bacteroidota bacterium]
MSKGTFSLLPVILAIAINTSGQTPAKNQSVSCIMTEHISLVSTGDNYGPDMKNTLLSRRVITDKNPGKEAVDILCRSFEKKLSSSDSLAVWSRFSESGSKQLYQCSPHQLLSGKGIISDNYHLDYKVPDRYVNFRDTTGLGWEKAWRFNGKSLMFGNGDGYDEETFRDRFGGIDFTEQWTFNTKTGKFSKNILFFGMVASFDKYDNYTGDFIGKRDFLVENGYFRASSSAENVKNQAAPDYGKLYLLTDSLVYQSAFSFEGYYSKDRNYLEPDLRNKLIALLFESLRNGSCKAYATDEKGNADFSKKIDFEDAIRKAGCTVRYYTGLNEKAFNNNKILKIDSIFEIAEIGEINGMDNVRIRSVKEAIEPVCKTDKYGNIIYKYDEYGEMLWDDDGNPVPEEIFGTITRYDTVWEKLVKVDSVWRVPYHEEKKIVEIEQYTEPVYKLDEYDEIIYKFNEYGEYVYDEEGNPVPEEILGTKEVIDTIWDVSVVPDNPGIFEKNGEQIADTVYHDRLSDVVGLRFYETWYLDTVNFCLYKKVKGISPVMKASKTKSAELINRCRYYYPEGLPETDEFETGTIYFELNQ